MKKNKVSDYSSSKQPILLCIDDDPLVSEAIAIRLQDYKVDVRRAFHGMHGYYEAMKEKPDLIITDLQMPQGEGDYVVECLRNNTERATVPIIVLTGKRDPAIESHLRSLGAQEFFAKPMRFYELKEAIEKYIPLHERELEKADA